MTTGPVDRKRLTKWFSEFKPPAGPQVCNKWGLMEWSEIQVLFNEGNQSLSQARSQIKSSLIHKNRRMLKAGTLRMHAEHDIMTHEGSVIVRISLHTMLNHWLQCMKWQDETGLNLITWNELEQGNPRRWHQRPQVPGHQMIIIKYQSWMNHLQPWPGT